MNKRMARWLLSELPELVRVGVLTAEDAQRLRLHYDLPALDSRRTTLTALGVLGAALVGLGILLVVGYNWNQLDRPVRAALSIAPLLTAQGLGFLALTRHRESSAWRESVALFQSLAVATAIALIGQTYNIPGNAGSFLLTWMLLSAPLVYIFDAAFLAALYLVGCAGWAGYTMASNGQTLLYWPLAAVMAPCFVLALRKGPDTPRAIGLSWALVGTLCVALAITMERIMPGLWVVVYASYFAVLCLTDAFWLGDSPGLFLRPFRTVGVGGLAVMSLLLTYRWPWRNIGWHFLRDDTPWFQSGAAYDYALALGLLIAAITLTVMCVRKGQPGAIVWGIGPILAAGCFGFGSGGLAPQAAMALFNLYLAALAIERFIAGARMENLAVLNTGLFLMAMLIIARFFDSDISFAVRGFGFILVGLGFLGANWAAARWMGGRRPTLSERSAL